MMTRLYVCLCVYLCICLFVSLSVSVSICLYVCLFACLFAWVPVYMSIVCMFACLSVCMHGYDHIWLWIWLWLHMATAIAMATYGYGYGYIWQWIWLWLHMAMAMDMALLSSSLSSSPHHLSPILFSLFVSPPISHLHPAAAAAAPAAAPCCCCCSCCRGGQAPAGTPATPCRARDPAPGRSIRHSMQHSILHIACSMDHISYSIAHSKACQIAQRVPHTPIGDTQQKNDMQTWMTPQGPHTAQKGVGGRGGSF